MFAVCAGRSSLGAQSLMRPWGPTVRAISVHSSLGRLNFFIHLDWEHRRHLLLSTSMLSLLVAHHLGFGPAPAPKPSDGVPGWLVERTLHSEAILCPWTTAPLEDDDCKWRKRMLESLRGSISTCAAPLARSNKVFAHRGAPLVAPEETEESWRIGVESGAGFIECDASITRSQTFVCRHSVCDLHFTTDILSRPELAAKCQSPFTPRTDGGAAHAECCTFDFEDAELAQLCATMEQVTNPDAATVDTYLLGAPGFRSPYIAQQRCHPLMWYEQYLALARKWRVNTIPELKDTDRQDLNDFLAATGRTVFGLADQFAREAAVRGFGRHSEAAVAKGGTVVLQTFDHRVAQHWTTIRPLPSIEFMWSTFLPLHAGEDDPDCKTFDCGAGMVISSLARQGVAFFGPPLQLLLSSAGHRTVPSNASVWYSRLAREHGAALMSWSIERSGCSTTAATPSVQPAAIGTCDWYWGSTEGISSYQHEDTLLALHVLFQDVGIAGIFADFPATASAYLNCVPSRA